MINRQTLLCTAALTLGAAAIAPSAIADPFLPVPPGSFLNYHVSTARGLSEEVAQDVVVRARLARHFQMSEPALVEYIRQNLVATKLTAAQAGRYKVGCISPSGREYYVSEHLLAGTPVFALASTGKPVLKLECGNPLVSSLPIVQAKAMPAPPMSPPVIASSPAAIPGQTLVASTIIPGTTTFTTAAPLSDYAFTGAGPIVNVGGITQVLSHSGGLNFLPGLIGAAALVGVTSHGSGSGGLAPVPEPSAVVPIVIGMVGLFGLGLIASRRTRANQA